MRWIIVQKKRAEGAVVQLFLVALEKLAGHFTSFVRKKKDEIAKVLLKKLPKTVKVQKNKMVNSSL